MVKELIENYKSSDYKSYVFSKDINSIRRTLLISVGLFLLFLLMDYFVYPELFNTFLTIRLYIVIPFLVFVYILSFLEVFEILHQVLLVLAMIVSGLSIIIMILLLSENNYYYNGLYLIYLVAFFLLRIRPIYVSISSMFLLIAFCYLAYFSTNFSIEGIVVISIFYFCTAVIGFIGSMFFERYRRNQYYQEKILVGENVVLAKENVEQYENIKNLHSATIFTLAKLVEDRDESTGDHLYRVGEITHMLANELPDKLYKRYGLVKSEFVEAIKLASLLHDIGKISISDVILNKPGRLTNAEFDLVKKHTIKGYETLKSYLLQYDNNLFIQLGMEITRSHHEQWNGLGYPDNLHEDEIPLSARIVSIIDVYDALVSTRVYKKAYSKGRSLAIIEKGKGVKFDPEITDIFIDLMKRTPSY